MDRRLTDIREELGQRLAVVSALPLQQTGAGGGASDRAVVGNIVTAMGDVASLVDSLEFQPTPVTPATAPRIASSLLPAPVARPAPAARAGHPEMPEPPEPPEGP